MQKMTHKLTRELEIFYNENHDACTSCSKDFIDRDTAHLGYIHERTPALFCDNCSHQLIETVVRYSWIKREYEIPKQNDMLWRYMDLSKFISLLGKRELFFSAAIHFSDPFEGAKGAESRKEDWDAYYKEFFINAIKTAPREKPSQLTEEDVARESMRLLGELHDGGKIARERTFINCWHMNTYESEAMWKLYSKDITNAIAIQTTYQRLYNALDKEPKIAIGKVQYINFLERYSSVNGAFWFKRLAFEYEKEVRLIAHDHTNMGKPGLSFPVDIDVLIENIYVSPYAPSWFYDVIKDVLEKYCVKKSVLKSQMKITPFY